jgi:hypothetical protein
MTSQILGGLPPVRRLEEPPAALAEDLLYQPPFVFVTAYEQGGYGTLMSRIIHGVHLLLDSSSHQRFT